MTYKSGPCRDKIGDRMTKTFVNWLLNALRLWNKKMHDSATLLGPSILPLKAAGDDWSSEQQVCQHPLDLHRPRRWKVDCFLQQRSPSCGELVLG